MKRRWPLADRNESLLYVRQRLPATPPAALQRQETSRHLTARLQRHVTDGKTFLKSL